MLEGECTLRLGEERLRFKAGDYAVFPAGAKVGHCLINETDRPCRYIVIGEDNPNEGCVYPDSNKVSNRWLGERYDRSAQRGLLGRRRLISPPSRKNGASDITSALRFERLQTSPLCLCQARRA